jgi:rhodanese-related sulfurtransferase
MAAYTEIDAATLHDMLENGQVLLVDVRNDDEVIRGVIPGAKHLPLHLLPIRANELPDGKPIVFYCHSGVRSAHACAFMANQGHENLFNLQGGVLAWGKAGYSFAPKA